MSVSCPSGRDRTRGREKGGKGSAGVHTERSVELLERGDAEPRHDDGLSAVPEDVNWVGVGGVRVSGIEVGIEPFSYLKLGSGFAVEAELAVLAA